MNIDILKHEREKWEKRARKLLRHRKALRAERDALRDEVERLTELAALSGEVFAFAITDSKLPNLETRRQLHDAVNRALDAARAVQPTTGGAEAAVIKAAKAFAARPSLITEQVLIGFVSTLRALEEDA
jgi:hypothetical protein